MMRRIQFWGISEIGMSGIAKSRLNLSYRWRIPKPRQVPSPACWRIWCRELNPPYGGKNVEGEVCFWVVDTLGHA